MSELARRAQPDGRDLQVLAGANALQSLAVNRPEALWQSVVAAPDWDILADKRVDDETPALDAPSEAEDVVSDYNAAGLTLGQHPLSLLRRVLLAHRHMQASTLRKPQRKIGAWLRTCHSEAEPSAAKGVTLYQRDRPAVAAREAAKGSVGRSAFCGV